MSTSRFALLLCALIVCVLGTFTLSAAEETQKIKHVVVLVMENRAFDHMVGFMKAENPEIDGCLPGLDRCSNPDDPSLAAEQQVWTTVSSDAVYRTLTDPDHSIHGTTKEIYPLGENSTSTDKIMSGFISAYRARGSTEPESIMQGFGPDHVPIVSQLIREFGLVDGWFAGVPGPTEPNRCYCVSATSHGMGTNDVETMVRGLPQKTMFSQVLDMGLDYRLYMKQVPANIMFKEMRRKDARRRYKMFGTFLDDLEKGTLPDFSFIEPAYFDTPNQGASDQHPDHDVSLGEALLKEVYEAVRASPVWESTALVITWDEHGGFFDHVTPPSTNVPNPDGINSTDDPFTFDRLGVRVPTLIISPYVPKGSVLHASPDGESQYEHSSIPATVIHKLLQPAAGKDTPPYLNARDAWARTFDVAFSEATPRTDTPVTLVDAPTHRILYPQSLPLLDGKQKITELQQTLVMLTAAVSKDPEAQKVVSEGVDSILGWTENEAMLFIEPRMERFMNDDSDDAPDA